MPFDHPRAEWHPSGTAVLDSNGNHRPPLDVPLSTFTVHWTGAGAWADTGDTASELRGIDDWARGEGKPNEYNSVVDSQSQTWEYAGPFRAAHSEGENETAWGNLVLLGPNDTITDDLMSRLVHGIRRMRWNLVQLGFLTADHAVVPHRQMPGASTACPGPLADDPDVWAAISAPIFENPDAPAPEPEPEPEPPEDEPPMKFNVIIRHGNYRFLYCPATNTKESASGAGRDPDVIVQEWKNLIRIAGGDAKVLEVSDTMFAAMGRVVGKKPFRLDAYGFRRF